MLSESDEKHIERVGYLVMLASKIRDGLAKLARRHTRHEMCDHHICLAVYLKLRVQPGSGREEAVLDDQGYGNTAR